MKIFIGGSKTINALDDNVRTFLRDLIKKQYDILIGDCYGVDELVQEYFAKLNYRKIKIYVSGQTVRNNLGNWEICSIPVKDDIKGYEFYRQKDIAMGNCAECGFMIWDGKSRGTFNNILNLAEQGKNTMVYFAHLKKSKEINEKKDILDLTIKGGN